MESVKLNREQLLDIVRENMQTHVEAYKEAIVDYTTLSLKTARQNLEIAETGDLEAIKKIKAPAQPPVSYENDYKRAIRMLELSVEDEIVIEQQIFNQLVLDEWTWKNHFATSNAFYKSAL